MLPTHAGDTSRLRCSSDHPSVHPRSRGEHTSPSAAASASFGSSPLARGTLAFIVIMPFLVRLIPARAGNTSGSGACVRGSTAHPRSRGEHGTPHLIHVLDFGSSPLARGTQKPPRNLQRLPRLIPARAGNTVPECRAARRVPAHPRSRGEHKATMLVAAAHTGSSPLARGTRGRDPRRQMRNRLIPARAGNTKAPGT